MVWATALTDARSETVRKSLKEDCLPGIFVMIGSLKKGERHARVRSLNLGDVVQEEEIIGGARIAVGVPDEELSLYFAVLALSDPEAHGPLKIKVGVPAAADVSRVPRENSGDCGCENRFLRRLPVEAEARPARLIEASRLKAVRPFKAQVEVHFKLLMRLNTDREGINETTKVCPLAPRLAVVLEDVVETVTEAQALAR